MRNDGSCEGKTAYPSKAAAVHRIHQQMGDRKRTKRNCGFDRHRHLEAYRCRHCTGWHVGQGIPSIPKKKVRSPAFNMATVWRWLSQGDSDVG